MKKTVLLYAFVLTASVTTFAVAHDVAPAAVVSAGDTTVVYVFPTSPQTFVPVSGLPSFLVMPGGRVPSVATQVIYTMSSPVPSAPIERGVDVDCSSFDGTVTISGADVFGLDRDGDGIGCEAEER